MTLCVVVDVGGVVVVASFGLWGRQRLDHRGPHAAPRHQSHHGGLWFFVLSLMLVALLLLLDLDSGFVCVWIIVDPVRRHVTNLTMEVCGSLCCC